MILSKASGQTGHDLFLSTKTMSLENDHVRVVGSLCSDKVSQVLLN